jgi:hypothetical protein
LWGRTEEGGRTEPRKLGALFPPRREAWTNVTVTFRSKRPAFHTPSVAFGDTFSDFAKLCREGFARIDTLGRPTANVAES